MRRFSAEAFLVILACFLLPFPAIGVPGMPITAADMLLFLALCLTLLRFRSLRVYVEPSAGWVLAWLGSGVLICAGLMLSDIAQGNTLYEVMRITGQYAWAYVAIPALLLTQNLRTIYHALIGISVGLFISVGTGLALSILAPSVYQSMTATGIFVVEDRVGAFLGPNAQAKMIAVMLPFVLWQVAMRTPPQWFWRLWLLLALGGLVGAASFAGLFSAVVATFGSLLILRRYFLRINMVFALAAIALYSLLSLLMPWWIESGFGAAIERISKPLESGALEDISSYNIRVWLMQEAWEQVRQSPWIGLGSGKYQAHSAFQIPVHNTYLLLWREGGILSLLGILLFGGMPLLLVLLRRFYGLQRRLPNGLNALLACCALAILIFMVNIFTNTNSFSRYTTVPATLFGLIVLRFGERTPEYTLSRKDNNRG